MRWKNIYFKNRIRILAVNCVPANERAPRASGKTGFLKEIDWERIGGSALLTTWRICWLAGFWRSPPRACRVTYRRSAGKRKAEEMSRWVTIGTPRGCDGKTAASFHVRIHVPCLKCMFFVLARLHRCKSKITKIICNVTSNSCSICFIVRCECTKIFDDNLIKLHFKFWHYYVYYPL